jgi:hypothetical protein
MAKDESNKKDEALFVQLVVMFQAAAMQQMGKVQNPITNKVERNLEQARFSIDMLEMIQNRTGSNLSDNEKKFLEHTLFELRMNYVDEVKRGEQKKKENESAPKDEEKGQPDSTQPSQETEKQKESDKDRPDSGEPSSK